MIGILCACFALAAFFGSAVMIVKMLENSDKARE